MLGPQTTLLAVASEEDVHEDPCGYSPVKQSMAGVMRGGGDEQIYLDEVPHETGRRSPESRM